MADDRRLKRYADMIKRALGEIIEFKLKDPNKGFITITGSKISADLKIASVYYTVLGDNEQRETTKMILNKSRAFLRSELKPFIKSRWLPEIRFFYDESQDEADKINKLLKQIENDYTSKEE
ncbi:MAG: 30S ribosome-binding factor RbfA [Calditrichaceae bacterium]|nr:30S ribosome-binding factor RbfA [Calditrichaceae bacterium]MBN2710379.1 30S ribosome-binding factor RbfA [Calditrichaceae bacterium]RQV92899.1 MAG: 30S ribosome-binding factor RbfA [Calditrichota bacterium]